MNFMVFSQFRYISAICEKSPILTHFQTLKKMVFSGSAKLVSLWLILPLKCAHKSKPPKSCKNRSKNTSKNGPKGVSGDDPRLISRYFGGLTNWGNYPFLTRFGTFGPYFGPILGVRPGIRGRRITQNAGHVVYFPFYKRVLISKIM